MNLEGLRRVFEVIGDRGSIRPVWAINRLPKDSLDRWALELAIHNYTSQLPWLAGKAISVSTMGLIIADAAKILAAEHAEV